MTSIGEKDTLTVEFKDSTYTIFEYSDRNLPWRIASFDNNDILVFDRQVIAIKQTDKNIFKGLLISEKDYKVTLEKRKTNWNKELLNGIWIEEKNYDLYLNDSLPEIPHHLHHQEFLKVIFNIHHFTKLKEILFLLLIFTKFLNQILI
ncbi:hypothetical protein [Lacinutrix algicola]|uniref:hypothetical protein n=1 Tax=Lacinutrix algicola TaxID=342954 RepID=UPI00128FA375|nr:hypothetical protein [Lacinutrix algicola]